MNTKREKLTTFPKIINKVLRTNNDFQTKANQAGPNQLEQMDDNTQNTLIVALKRQNDLLLKLNAEQNLQIQKLQLSLKKVVGGRHIARTAE